ncbi:hypothetical protein Fcan01_09375 [Folsomia candida]|uniref:Uncharacterized protein n=1 Tax=Folsomia candida TaxID=158441 RepID=A0A226EG95_FOLCA|nr:hypothetical protein Fcan01_09375 [Folsomia candida]
MAYAEKPAFLQFFQIIMLAISLGLESYAFMIDRGWKKTLNKNGKGRICPWLIQNVNEEMYNYYKAQLPDQFNGTDNSVEKRFFMENISRGSGEETAAIALISFSIVLLLVHLVLACISRNNSYRTKWTASVQGISVFASGFAAIFIAISSHEYRSLYHSLSSKLLECILLPTCVDDEYKNTTVTSKYLKLQGFKNPDESAEKLRNVFSNNYVCQAYDMKIASAAICGVMILLSFIIICSAMDLTTIYNEEDVDEEERKRRLAFHMHALHVKRRQHTKSQSRNS